MHLNSSIVEHILVQPHFLILMINGVSVGIFLLTSPALSLRDAALKNHTGSRHNATEYCVRTKLPGGAPATVARR